MMDLDILGWYIVGRAISFIIMMLIYLVVPLIILVLGIRAFKGVAEPLLDYKSWWIRVPTIAILYIIGGLTATLTIGSLVWLHNGGPAQESRKFFFEGYGSYYAKEKKEKEVDTQRQLVKAATRIDLSPELRRFTLVHLDPPKHVYVTLKDVENGGVHERVYVSKHCNSYRDNKDGDQFNILMKRWRLSSDPETTVRYEFTDLYSVFCR